ncbi:MAG: alpha/beta fold hydrolase [Sphaerochaetaceae bacterium]|jgi:pimeloyl-ACP methyl ester carboxylesterase|nr:alpha/beta hydrolase [Sphaerochaetaceae bacterium]HHU88868.1 alpha/beta hydrolase [Spirochaetales bacterium]
MLKVKEGSVETSSFVVDYVAFGQGSTPLILIPGLADGLQTVKGKGLPLALLYRRFAKDFRVYSFSRKRVLEEGYTTQDMARELMIALKEVERGPYMVMGISQGGMIGQHLALLYPEEVKRLVLGVSSSRPNPILVGRVVTWINLAKEGDFKELLIDTFENTYTPKRLRLYRPLYPFLVKAVKEENIGRFLIQAEACLTHNTYEQLDKIGCPTLIMGGAEDTILGAEASREMAAKIEGSLLKIFPKYGHGLYEEERLFNQEALNFFLEGINEKV